MAYTCAVFPTADATLEEAQAEKFDLVSPQARPQARQRLLDVGCGWGGMVRHAAKHYGVTALGVTLSAEQAKWAQLAIQHDRLDRRRGRARRLPRRHRRGYDAVSSIGLTEHIGVKNYAAYFGFLHDKLRDGGRLLNHCITRPDNQHARLTTGALHRPLRLP